MTAWTEIHNERLSVVVAALSPELRAARAKALGVKQTPEQVVQRLDPYSQMVSDPAMERQQSIAGMAGLRDAVEAYEASCVESYTEVNLEDHSELDAWWASVPEFRRQKIGSRWHANEKGAPSFKVTDDEKATAEAWLAKYESRLPKPDDGADSYMGLYEFLTSHDTRSETGDYEDDRDGVTFAEEFFRPVDEFIPQSEVKLDAEKAEAYDGKIATLDKESARFPFLSGQASGPLASSWQRIEKALGVFWDKKEISPSQFLRLERSTKKPHRRQHRGSRAKNSNWSVMQKVWDDIRQALGVQTVEKFYAERYETFMAFDPVANQYRELPKFTLTDDVAVDAERRRMTKASPRPRNAQLVLNPEPQPYGGPALRYPPPVREFDGALTPVAFQASPACREWLWSGDYDSLLAFRQRITQAA